MRATVLLTLTLASCAQSAPEITREIDRQQPKAALRAQIVPGMTLGNVALQEETTDAATRVITAETEYLDCASERMHVSDTWPYGNPTPSEYSNAFLRWTELWTFEVCGSDVEVAVVYMLHKESGAIDIRVSRLEEAQTLELS